MKERAASHGTAHALAYTARTGPVLTARSAAQSNSVPGNERLGYPPHRYLFEVDQPRCATAPMAPSTVGAALG